MAPEQRGGGEPQARSDLYACGVMLYEMLTGERPAGTDLPSDLNRAVPKYLDEVFRRSYARLDKRYASAAEFLAAIAPAARRSSRPAASRCAAMPRRSRHNLNAPNARNRSSPATSSACIAASSWSPKSAAARNAARFPMQSDRYCIFCGETLLPQTVTA